MSATIPQPTATPNYDVVGQWAEPSELAGAQSCWVHNAVAATDAGDIIAFHGGQLIAFDTHGRLRHTVQTGLTEGHGVTLVNDGGVEYLWVSDPGFVFTCAGGDGNPNWAPLFGRGVDCQMRDPRVVKMTLDGEIQSELPLPPHNPAIPAGPMGPYCPCGCVVDEERFGGSGDIWVADGYGSGVVHRFNKYGDHQLTLTGEDSGQRLACPHAIFIDRRGGKSPELYIADRVTTRVLVYDLDGRYLRSFGAEFLNSPSDFAVWGDLLVIAELYARLAVLGPDDSLLGYIGADPDITGEGWPSRPGWPNALTEDGSTRIPQLSHPDRFNSPHSVTTDPDGNLYVSEWILGGRYTKLSVQH